MLLGFFLLILLLLFFMFLGSRLLEDSIIASLLLLRVNFIPAADALDDLFVQHLSVPFELSHEGLSS